MNIPESNLRNILDSISKVNHILNEIIRLYKSEEIDCPDCLYDPIRKESTNYDCDTCGGSGNIETKEYKEISASVDTESDYEFSYTQAGRLTKNQILVNIDIKEIKEVLDIDNNYDLYNRSELEDFIDQYDYIVWVGGRYKVESYEPGFLQGNLYEIALTCSLIE